MMIRGLVRATSWLPIAACLVIAGPAFAQDDEEGGEDAAEVDPLAPAEGTAGEEAGTTAEGRGDEKLDAWFNAAEGEFPRISDDEETIYAVQRKAYLVDSKIELSVMGAATFTDRFVQHWAPAASVTYHLAENFGIEAVGSVMFPQESDLTTEIGALKLRPEIAKLTQMLWAAGLGAQWSPIYGKLEIFGASLGNFNFYLSVDVGFGQTRVQCVVQREKLDENQFGAGAECAELEDPNDPTAVVYEPNRFQFMTSFAGGFLLYFNESFGLKLEVRDWMFPARVFKPDQGRQDRFTDTIRNNLFFQVGVSFLLGGSDD